MKNCSRLVVRFPLDAVVDVEGIYAVLRDAYHIGYIALHDCDTHLRMYMQTASRNARMAPGKVLKICAAFGAQAQTTFSDMAGTPLTKIGVFRRRGHNTGETREEAIDEKIEPTRGKVYIFIRAVGDEDVSRISMQQFKELLYGGTEELIEHVKQGLDETVLNNFIENQWNDLQCELQTLQDDSASTSGDGNDSTSGDGNDSDFSLPNIVFVNGELIKYDPDFDSEYNRVARSTVTNVVMSQLALTRASYEVAIKFAGLLYSNPHNNKLFRTKKSGHIQYFDGIKWATQRVCDADLVKNWQQKFRECFALFEERSENGWEGSFQRNFAEALVKVFGNPMCFGFPITGERKDQRDAIDLVGGNHARVVAVHTATGKKVVRVLSESHAECRGKTVLNMGRVDVVVKSLSAKWREPRINALLWVKKPKFV